MTPSGKLRLTVNEPGLFERIIITLSKFPHPVIDPLDPLCSIGVLSVNRYNFWCSIFFNSNFSMRLLLKKGLKIVSTFLQQNFSIFGCCVTEKMNVTYLIPDSTNSLINIEVCPSSSRYPIILYFFSMLTANNACTASDEERGLMSSRHIKDLMTL